MCVLDEWGAKLLEGIISMGDIDRSAVEAGMQAEDAEDLITHMEQVMGQPLVSRGSDTNLTDAGKALLFSYKSQIGATREVLRRRYRNPMITVDGVLMIDGQLVLIRRGRDPFKGLLALPGGFVDYGERVEEAILRELREETGMEGRIIDVIGIYSAPERDPRGHTISIVFHLAPSGGSLKAGDDADAVGLYDPSELPDLAFDHGSILSEFLSRHRE